MDEKLKFQLTHLLDCANSVAFPCFAKQHAQGKAFKVEVPEDRMDFLNNSCKALVEFKRTTCLSKEQTCCETEMIFINAKKHLFAEAIQEHVRF